jgi:nucleoside-diphosphate-sugar epimerase
VSRSALQPQGVAGAPHVGESSATVREGGDTHRHAVVTGAAGFIGRHLVEALRAEGWQVRALDVALPERRGGEHPAGDRSGEAGGEVALRGAVTWFSVDIRDREALGPLLQGADVVLHLASAHLQHRAPEGWYASVNVEGTRTLVEEAGRAGVRRFVHVSSVGVYGHVESPPADEDGPLHPTNEYERTKRLGEAAARAAGARGGPEVVVLRPGWVYGTGCPRTARLLRTIRRGRFFYVGDGSNLRHPIHVSDTVRAMRLAVDAPGEVAGETYLVVGPRAVRVRDLVETCARLQGVRPPRLQLPRLLVGAGLLGVEFAFGLLRREPPASRRSLAFFEHDNAFSGKKAEHELGFVPALNLEDGMRETLASGSQTSGGEA